MTDPETSLALAFAALSDVGRVRKDNQDSGYAGPHLLAVCDGVGGAARGDIASSTAVQQLAKLDLPPDGEPLDSEALLGAVAGAVHRAHDRIAELVEEDPALTGTSTTLTVALFDGQRAAIGHVGDSRAYLYRNDELSQLTADHTFVQSLIDEGRITEDEARVHPHRNMILKAVDGVHDADPDLFIIELAAGDRIFLCSDGACGVLDQARIADILGTGTPDYAAVEMVRASLDAGSSDNVTCVVADVHTSDELPEADAPGMVVGAAAELPKRKAFSGGSRFRGHRSGDTGEIEPVAAELPPSVEYAIPNDPIDPEARRYAPRAPGRFGWLKVSLALVAALGVVWIAVAGAWSWTQTQYFISEQDGKVTIFRGIQQDLPGLSLSNAVETSNIDIDSLGSIEASGVRKGIQAETLDDARRRVENLGAERDCSTPPVATPSAVPSASPSGGPSAVQPPRPTANPTAQPSSNPLTTPSSSPSPVVPSGSAQPMSPAASPGLGEGASTSGELATGQPLANVSPTSTASPGANGC